MTSVEVLPHLGRDMVAERAADEAQAYLDTLLIGAEGLQIALHEGLAEALLRHQSLVDRWSAKMNLTRIQGPLAKAELHALDSLLFGKMVPPDRTLLEVVDVGSGAGFPGVVLGLAYPAWKLTLLEPTRRRASFLRVALADLGRADITVREGRLDVGDSLEQAPWPCDAIVSRATLPLESLVALSAPRLRPGGFVIVSSGGAAMTEERLLELAKRVRLRWAERRRFVLPSTGQHRVLDRFERPALREAL